MTIAELVTAIGDTEVRGVVTTAVNIGAAIVAFYVVTLTPLVTLALIGDIRRQRAESKKQETL